MYQSFSEKENLQKWNNVLLDENNRNEYLKDVSIFEANEFEENYKTDYKIHDNNQEKTRKFEINSNDTKNVKDLLSKELNNIEYTDETTDKFSELKGNSEEAIYLEFIESHNSRDHVDKWIDKTLTSDNLEEFKSDLIKHSEDKDMGYYKTYIEKTDKNGEVVKSERFDLNNEIFEVNRLIEFVKDNMPQEHVELQATVNKSTNNDKELMLSKFEDNIPVENKQLKKYLNYFSEENKEVVIDLINSTSKQQLPHIDISDENNIAKLSKFNYNEVILFKEVLDTLDIDNELDFVMDRAVDNLSEKELDKLEELELSSNINSKVKQKQQEIAINKMSAHSYNADYSEEM